MCAFQDAGFVRVLQRIPVSGCRKVSVRGSVTGYAGSKKGPKGQYTDMKRLSSYCYEG